MSSGSVVFALPHLRDAIFFYHAEEIVRLRKTKLDAIDRPVGPAFWQANAANYRDEDISRGLAAKHRSFVSDTNLLSLMQALGLEMATYLDVLASRKEDLGFWLGACSRLEPSQKWKDANGRDCRLQAVSSSYREGRAFIERGDSTAAEGVYYGAGGCLAQLPGSPGPWEESCGLNHLLRDRGGRIFIARLAHLERQPFIFEAAAKQPDLLYSPRSPFWPVYDAVEYNLTSQIGVIITQMPPFPLSRLLAAGQSGTRDELRRVLEHMQHIFHHLATLEEYGVSFHGMLPSDSWMSSFDITSSRQLWLMSAYLQRVTEGRGPGRLARGDCYEEQLPPPPADAWPVAPFEGGGGTAGLPWSQATAYSDPRVQGPKVFLHTVEAYWTTDKYQLWKIRGTWHGALIPNTVQPAATRYHSDLLSFTEVILRRFFPIWGLDHGKVTNLLRSGALADAYEECIAKGSESGPSVPARGHSGLFSFCLYCHCQHKGDSDWSGSWGRIDRCSACKRSCLVNAMPKAIQDLLLRIMEPGTDQDGTAIVFTAKEALATVDAVMAAELPRMLSTYQAWVDKQNKVVRMVKAPPTPLSRIDTDIRKDRLLLLELMRGSYMDVMFTRKNKEYREARDIVKVFLDRKKVEAEAEASRAGASSTSTAKCKAAAAAPSSTAAIGSTKRSANVGQDDEEEAGAKKAKVA